MLERSIFSSSIYLVLFQELTEVFPLKQGLYIISLSLRVYNSSCTAFNKLSMRLLQINNTPAQRPAHLPSRP